MRNLFDQSIQKQKEEHEEVEFSDGVSEVELRLFLKGNEVEDSGDVFVEADGTSLIIKLKSSGSVTTLLETNHLYDKIKPAETIWYIDEDQLVINLKKYDPELKWPDIMETWESLAVGVVPILKGSSLYIVGESTKINQKVAKELAVGLGYTPLNTSELLEAYGNQSIDSWVIAEGGDSVAEAEGAILESLSSHVRAVVATLGGQHGAASKDDKWRHLYSGFTIWLSQSDTDDEDSTKEEARMQIKDGSKAYTNADVVVKLGGWDPDLSQTVAQACLSAIKRLILSDKKLPGKKSLYIRLGCRGDWPNIKPPGWDPSSGAVPQET
ncbi:shikimate kinase like [Thalictrum thalictroides]|uniref:Shikimate kinase like n=1 Tax=Thalictrum thalictroides TaxID=46969 RepID=A0A7J6W456_THATH|nr:shikimate kinase like [Thalictrum thalictroides]